MRAEDRAPPSATHLQVPVTVLAGRGFKPVLVAVAGVHGDEADSQLALLDLARELAPGRLTGRLVLVPFVNPPAFAAGRRRSPIDDMDLNRVFSGRSSGRATERLAHALFEGAVRANWTVVSLYGLSRDNDALPHVEIGGE